MNAPQGPAAPESGSTDVPTFETLAADPEIAPLLDFEPVPRELKKANGWTPAMQRMFIGWLAHYGSPGKAADELGKARSGIDKVYKAEGADSFRKAWDDAIALAERRLTEQLASRPASAGTLQAPFARVPRGKSPPPLQGEGWGEGAPGQILNEHGEYEDEDSYRRRVADAVDSIGGKLVRCRRAFLAEISGSPGKRAAFEILTELPVDWELAARLEPQPFEPWTPTNQRQPDMVLTAEAGWQSGIVPYGPAKVAEMRRAIDEHRSAQGLEPVAWIESPYSNPPPACLGEGDHAEHGGGAG